MGQVGFHVYHLARQDNDSGPCMALFAGAVGSIKTHLALRVRRQNVGNSRVCPKVAEAKVP